MEKRWELRLLKIWKGIILRKKKVEKKDKFKKEVVKDKGYRVERKEKKEV